MFSIIFEYMQLVKKLNTAIKDNENSTLLSILKTTVKAPCEVQSAK